VVDSTRPTWDNTWMAVARTVALRSLCERDRVGAVIVSKSNRLLETGYNGPPSGFRTDGVGCSSWCTRAMYSSGPYSAGTTDTIDFPPRPNLKPDYSDCPSLHAEANALMRGDRSAREGGTIYVTSGMCFGCGKLVANSGLALVVIDEVGNPNSHRNCEKTYRFLESCGLTVVTG
jgi:dCMP deaminase